MADKLAVVQAQETIEELQKIEDKTKDLIVEFKELIKVSKDINKQLKTGTPKEYAKSIKEMNTATKEFNKSQMQLANQLTRVTKLERQVAQLLRDQSRAIRDVANATRDESRAREAAERVNTQANRTAREAANAQAAQSRATREINRETDNLTAAERRLIQVERQLGIAQSEQAGQIANVSAQTRLLNAEQRNRALMEERLAMLSDRERQRLGNTMQIYNSVQQKLNRLQAEYRNLATAKELGMRLSETEIARMTALENRIRRYDQTLKAVDGSMGIYRRNVGNYASGFNAMNNSVAQLAREAPAFTYSMQTGFMAISNNLPILFDSLKSAREENARLNAEGKKGVPVWKQFASALFSWNTVLSIGITLLTVYGKEIGDWIKIQFQGVKAVNLLKKATEDLNEARIEGNKNAADELVNSRLSEKIIKDETVARHLRLKEAENLQKLYPQIFGNMTTEQMLLDTTTTKYDKLRKAIVNTAIAEALKNKMAKATEEYVEKELKNLDDVGQAKIKVAKLEDAPYFEGSMSTGGTMGASVIRESSTDELRWAREELEEKRKIRKADTDGYNAYMNRMLNITEKYQIDGAPANSTYNPTKTPKAKLGLTAEQRDHLATLQAKRDNAITVQKQLHLDLEINEVEYQKRYINIIKDYAKKVGDYLSGKNGKEKAIEASVKRRAVEELERSLKEIYDFEKKQIEETGKMKINELERSENEISNNQYMYDAERLSALIENDDKIIKQFSETYNFLIELAKKYGFDTIELERKRDEEIGKIQDDRNKRMMQMPEALNNDANRQAEINANIQNVGYEERKLEIMQSRMNWRDKEFALSHLELQNQKQILEGERQYFQLQKDKLDQTENLTVEQQKQYTELLSQLAKLDVQIEETNQNISKLNIAKFAEDAKPVIDYLTQGLSDLGLDNVVNQFSEMYDKILKEGDKFKLESKDVIKASAALIADVALQYTEAQKNQTISALDEQLKYTQETTEQEIGFINQRLERLNALDELNAEQIAERNQLEDEARTLKEQQMQREKMIETQKAKAEQKAAANQALINGALAATMTLAQMGFIAGAIPAGLALAFGVAQSIAIMSKDPVPKYFVGRKGGKAEMAITQDGGREMITDKKGNIKSLGSDRGDQLTWLDEGDTVHTAVQTKDILKRLGAMPKLGDNLFKKLTMQSLMAPTVVIQKQEDNSEKIAELIGQKFERALKRYDKPVILKENGKIIKYRGANLGEIIGEYDNNGKETYYGN